MMYVRLRHNSSILLKESESLMNRNQRTAPRTSFHMEGFYPGIIDACITELRSVLSYLEKVARFVSDEQKNFRDRLETKTKENEIGEGKMNFFYDAHYEDIQELHAFFPTALRSSVLTFAFSLFESRLVEACKFLDKHSLARSCCWADTKDRGLKKVARFLRKNFSIHPEDHDKWNLILQFLLVRNCFVHANGDIELMKNSAKNDLKKALPMLSQFGVYLSDIDKIIIEESTVSFAVQAMEEWAKSFWITCRENAVLGPQFWP